MFDPPLTTDSRPDGEFGGARRIGVGGMGILCIADSTVDGNRCDPTSRDKGKSNWAPLLILPHWQDWRLFEVLFWKERNQHRVNYKFYEFLQSIFLVIAWCKQFFPLYSKVLTDIYWGESSLSLLLFPIIMKKTSYNNIWNKRRRSISM